MLITPRYDGPAVLRFVGPIGDLSIPLTRQRRRLGDWLGRLDEPQWAGPTRCEGWSIRDVIAHLVGTDQFWYLSVAGALAGEPTRFLTRFDPVATPAAMVHARRDLSSEEVLREYIEGVAALSTILADLDEDQWSLPGEAPPGHVPLHVVARHALWDAWVHERDVMIPMDDAPVEEPDEVRACLEYAAALSPAFLASSGSGRTGSMVFEGTDPDARVVVNLGDTAVVGNHDAAPDAVHIRGRSVELVEALSLRAPYPHEVAEQDRWMLTGLATVFDLAPDG